VLTFVSVTPQQRLLALVGSAMLGWMLPFLYLKKKVRARQDELQRSLPDALDLMVVCVEAGLGLNQALVRVGEEMDRVSTTLAEELTLVSLEIRAGTPREEALANLGKRTGVSDIRAFTSMLIQTDRFGTSIADALRVHADELRTKRRQRAEEEAAKLTVKMLIPIVMFIFPAIFLVILGPAVFHVSEFFGMF
jgi:tight adherence protein C